MYLDAKQQDRPTAGDLAISSARQSLQELLFDGLDHRISFDLGLPRKVFFYGDVSGIGADLWGWAVHQGAELLLRDGKGVDCAWIAANARAFDCMIVHAEYLDDLEDTVDFCMNVRQAVPGLQAVVITDPFNTVYGSLLPGHLAALEDAGVRVVMTRLPRLRDPNPLWSAVWRLCCQWLGNDRGSGWLPNPFGEKPVTLRSYLRLLNFKANHRKTLVVDEGETWTGLVTSANPHDASSAHSNVALRFSGAAALDLLETEGAVARMSGAALPTTPEPGEPDAVDRPAIQVLTEAAIRRAALSLLRESRPGERVDMAMFYLSHRGIVDGLIAAHERGVMLRVLLDSNRDAFGRTKQGIPNRQVGLELHRAGIPVRWCHTSGEQCHSKLLMHTDEVGEVELILGSANFTRRNLDNYNLESDVRLLATSGHPAVRQAKGFFERAWRNVPEGRSYSLPYEAFADDSRLRYWQYRVMEASGLSTF